MNTIIRVCLVMCTFGVLAGRGAEPVVRVAASAELRLAIVDAAKATPTREAVHQAFAASLGAAMGETGGGAVPVKRKWVGADQAAFGLGAGVYDVVLVISSSLPRQLVLSDMTRLNATLGAEKHQKKAFLIFPQADEGLQKLLTQSFATAISNQQFLDALDGGFEPAADPANGPKLASTQE